MFEAKLIIPQSKLDQSDDDICVLPNSLGSVVPTLSAHLGWSLHGQSNNFWKT